MPFKESYDSGAIIKVIGVGGGGGNAVNTMIESGVTNVEFIAANTDIQALQSNKAPIKIQLGRELTRGLGAGACPEIGRDAALEDKAIIQEVLSGADMVFVTAGMGGGTGTGAAPIIAEVARELGALTVGVVTKPFIFEGKRRRVYSENGIQNLQRAVDTLITIPNQRLLAIAPLDLSMLDGFRMADEVLLNAVKGISDIMNIHGYVNADFADVKTIMAEMGMALMGIGRAKGAGRAAEAARAAISSPLLEDVDIDGATGILINITGPKNMTLHETSEACSLIQDAAHEDANIIFGTVVDETLEDEIRVTVIATGFDRANVAHPDQLQAGRRTQAAPPGPQSLFGAQAAHPHHNQVPTNRPDPRGHASSPNYETRYEVAPSYRPQSPQPPSRTQPPNVNETHRPQPMPQRIERPVYNHVPTPPRNEEPTTPPPVSQQNEFEELAQWTLDHPHHHNSEPQPAENFQKNSENTEPNRAEPHGDPDTEAALNLARELSNLPITDQIETPAFMRRRDENNPSSPR